MITPTVADPRLRGTAAADATPKSRQNWRHGAVAGSVNTSLLKYAAPERAAIPVGPRPCGNAGSTLTTMAATGSAIDSVQASGTTRRVAGSTKPIQAPTHPPCPAITLHTLRHSSARELERTIAELVPLRVR